MKTKTTTALLALLTAALVTHAGNLTLLRFTRTDGTLWQISTANPNSETALGASPPVGSHTNVWAGYTYTIDPFTDTLVRDGCAIGYIDYGGPHPFDVQRHYGFCIDSAGNGWLASTDSDADNLPFLLKISLATGQAVIINSIGPPTGEDEDLFQINGMIVYTPGFP